MKAKNLTIPEIALIGGTRVALGVGVGLIVADKMDDSKRKGAGWALLAVGVMTTIPLLLSVFGKGAGPNAASGHSARRLSHSRVKVQR